MRPRGPLPPGPALLLAVAIVAIPEVLRRCKPISKAVGDFLVKAGEEVHKLAGTDETVDAPNQDVKTDASDEKKQEETAPPIQNETTKVGAGTEDIDLETASPIGHEEVSAQIAAEAQGDGGAVEPIDPIPQKEAEPIQPPQPENPKQTQPTSPE